MGVELINRLCQMLMAQRALLLPVALLGMLAVVVVPLPTGVIDLLIAANLTLAALVLLTAVLVHRPLDFSAFPSLLLAATLFRLSLNVATTRTILTADVADATSGTAAAGRVIESFAGFVTGDSVIVGAVLFGLLVVIQFVVITRGSERISEVAARFVLDALPGKQMAVDAELAAGFIDQQQAREKREELARETDFYGSMDGASKFVRGDAIAGLVITLVNIVGGLAVGVFEKGWTIAESAAVFTRLTIGDGLVSQLPAVIVAVAAGMIMTRSSQRQQLGTQLTGQLGSQWTALALASAFLFLMAFTGLPAIPMIALGAVLAALAWWSYRSAAGEAAPGDGAPAPAQWRVTNNRSAATSTPATTSHQPAHNAASQARQAAPTSSGQRAKLLTSRATPAGDRGGESPVLARPPAAEPLTLELGLRLTSLVQGDDGQAVLPRLEQMRRRVAERLGWVVPAVVVRDDWQLPPRSYRVTVRGQVVAEGQVYPGRLMVRRSLAARALDEAVRPSLDPVTGEEVAWIEPGALEDVDRADSALAVLMRHLEDVVQRHAHELLTREATAQMVDEWRAHAPRLCDDVLGPANPGQGAAAGPLRLSELHRVLQNLLREQVSIADLETVLEVLGDWAGHTSDPDVLTEYVRLKLARTVVAPLLQAMHGVPVLSAIRLSQRAEACVTVYLSGQRVNMSDADVAAFDGMIEQLRQAVKSGSTRGVKPAVIAAPAVRRLLRDELQRRGVDCAVVAETEVPAGLKVDVLVEAHWGCNDGRGLAPAPAASPRDASQRDDVRAAVRPARV